MAIEVTLFLPPGRTRATLTMGTWLLVAVLAALWSSNTWSSVSGRKRTIMWQIAENLTVAAQRKRVFYCLRWPWRENHEALSFMRWSGHSHAFYQEWQAFRGWTVHAKEWESPLKLPCPGLVPPVHLTLRIYQKFKLLHHIWALWACFSAWTCK